MAKSAFAAALRMRKNAGYRLDEAICVYDIAEQLGVEVRFADIPSMEGMLYCNPDPVIIVSSQRPSGRRTFTCAHELGHFHSGDGTTIDELVGGPDRADTNPKEFMANCFAGALLMPKMAVEGAFAIRNWSARNPTAGQLYIVSGYFGVGYSTLVYHMWKSLRLLSGSLAGKLLRVSRRKAQAQALGWDSASTVWILDPNWNGRPIDMEVGELVQVHEDSEYEGSCLEDASVSGSGRLYRACQPGIGKLSTATGWAGYVRVSRREFVGRSIFRHLEDRDEEGSDGN